MVSGIVILVIVVLILMLMGAWTRKLDQEEKEKAIAEIGVSYEKKSHKALTQYPQIKPYLCIGCGLCIEACPEDKVIGLINGIAHIIHGSRCIGAAECEKACPVGAIKVGLGDVSSRPDIPILTEDRETSVPGVYIAGELGGLSLIKTALTQGQETVLTIQKKLKEKPIAGGPDVVDIVIVGSGPSGMAATFKCTELKIPFVTVCQDDPGGTVKKFPRRKITLVQSVNIPLYGILPGREYAKEEIVDIWEAVIKKHNIKITHHTALESVKKEGDILVVKTSSGEFKGRAVMLCLGRRGTPRRLGVPGEEGEKLLYQLVDASTYNDEHILVVGGGDSAIEAAIALASQKGNTVCLSYRKDNFMRLKSTNEKRIAENAASGKIRVEMGSAVDEITPKTVKMTIKGKSGPEKIEIPNTYTFVFAGGDPPYPLLQSFGIKFGGDAETKKELVDKTVKNAA